MLSTHPQDLLQPPPTSRVNIYRDGEKEATAPAEGLSWNDEAAAGVHTYRVSAVYNLSESRLSNEAKVGESGIGNVGADSFRVSVSASRITVTGSGDADVMLYGPTVVLQVPTARAPERPYSPSPRESTLSVPAPLP